MRTVFSRSMILLLAASPLAAPPALADNAGITVGTSGLAADWTVPVGQQLQTRVHLSYLKADVDEESDDVKYAIQFDNVQLGVLLDWHPLDGGFRVSGGLVTADFEFDMSADAQSDYKLGDDETQYTGNLRLDGGLDFNRVAPYVGVGWGAAVGETGLSFVADIGVLLIGKPTLGLDASGTACEGTGDVCNVGSLQVDVAANAQFQRDLEEERIKAQKDLEDFSFYPVINLGMSYAY